MRSIKACLLSMLAAGCADEPPPEPALGTTTQHATARLANPLDAPIGKQGVADLRTSQLVRLPSSWFFESELKLEGPQRMVVRTFCNAPEEERRDSGLLVVKSRDAGPLGWEVVEARYNDDVGGENCPTCSEVAFAPTTSGTYRYQVYAFSNHRTKAFCQVRYSKNPNATQFFNTLVPPGRDANTPLDLGGALVDLGPVERDTEWLEVQTPDNGITRDTKLLVFDVGGSKVNATSQHVSKYAPVLSKDNGNDMDPRIAQPGSFPIEVGLCANPPCSEPRHFALVGLEALPPARPSSIHDVEGTVSLTRGPEDLAAARGDVADAFAPLVVAPAQQDQCGTPIDASVGRFSAVVRALSRAEYGEDRGIRGDASWLLKNWDDDTQANEPDDDQRALYFRGTPNFRAFRMRVQARSKTGSWTNITATRDVPNGAFGCVDACFDTLLEDFELFQPAEVRVCIDNADKRIAFEGLWGVRRNTPSAELKLATFNVHHGDQGAFDSGGLENGAESRNISNLLATRGRFRPEMATVLETRFDAPFEWNADIVAMQEHSFEASYQQILDQAELQTDLDWRFVWGAGKVHHLPYYRATNSVFAPSLLANNNTLFPPAVDGCNTDTPNLADGRIECEHDASTFDFDVDYTTYSVPAQISVKRWGQGTDVPVLVLSVMMQPGGDDGPEIESRHEELVSLIGMLEAYVRDHPEVVGAGSSDPKDRNIRIVLAGDFNMYPHRIGENRWFVRELRRVFGYAVDTAAAHRDSYRNFYDMHAWRGVANLEYPGSNEPDTGLPFAYTKAQTWRQLNDTTTWWWDDPMQNWPHFFPYWARTYYGGGSGYDGNNAGHDRHDGVFLVGTGWSNDDAVRGYVVMNTTAEFGEYGTVGSGSPFAIRDASGNVVAVDISPNKAGEDGDVSNTWGEHYAPQFNIDPGLHDGCTTSGCSAAESDHIPVGVRLRITTPVE